MSLVDDPNVTHGTVRNFRNDMIRRGLVAAAAILLACSSAGCMVEAMYAVPIALDGVAGSIARALPMDEKKYVVHSPRMPAAEPALAARPQEPVGLPPVAQAPSPAPAPASPQPPAAAAPSPANMPTLSAGALAQRTRT